MNGTKIVALVATCSLALAASASASGPTVAWTRTDMTTALRAIGYPKPHPKKLACKGIGPADATGAHTSYRCVATYKHHRHARFYAGGAAEGGWLCAAKTLAGCKFLRKGFVTTGALTADGSMGAAADLAARGYMQAHYGTYTVTHFCEQTSSSTFSCPFSTATVTITFKQAKGGYITTAAQS